MAAQSVADFFAVVLLGALIATALLAFSPAARPVLANAAPALTAAIAAGAMGGSLYFSEGAGFEPCELCWFQRIAMYPLAVILVAARFRRDRALKPYVLLLAVGGLAVSGYHIQLQWWPQQGSFCALDNPCSAAWVEGLGFMTIPQMAAASFALIAGLTFLYPRETQ